MFEVFLRMPAFHFDTDTAIEATVENEFTFDKIGFGNCLIRWYAKKIDHSTPLYNDTMEYRREFAYFQNLSNTRRAALYDTKDGVPLTNLSRTDSEQAGSRYGFLDPYAETAGRPVGSRVNRWTYLASDRWVHTGPVTQTTRTFTLSLSTVEQQFGTLRGVQVRAEAFVTDFWYNNTQKGWCETRVVPNTLSLAWLGTQPLVFKPGMPLDGIQVGVRHWDRVAVATDRLAQATLTLTLTATGPAGETVVLQEAGPTGAGGECEDGDEDCLLASAARSARWTEFQQTGVHRLAATAPAQATQIRLLATYTDPLTTKEILAETTAWAAYAPRQQFLHVQCSTRHLNIGQYAVFHVKTNFPLEHFDWMILSKSLVVASGREWVAGQSFSTSHTFSLVTSSHMAPGFHILVYTVTSQVINTMPVVLHTNLGAGLPAG